MPAPTYADLCRLLGRDPGLGAYSQQAVQSDAVLGIVTAMASSYTRGQGFTVGVPNSEIAAVILTAAARLIAHPRQLGVSENLGPQSASWRDGFTGWTVAELFVLNRYRKRAE